MNDSVGILHASCDIIQSVSSWANQLRSFPGQQLKQVATVIRIENRERNCLAGKFGDESFI